MAFYPRVSRTYLQPGLHYLVAFQMLQLRLLEQVPHWVLLQIRVFYRWWREISSCRSPFQPLLTCFRQGMRLSSPPFLVFVTSLLLGSPCLVYHGLMLPALLLVVMMTVTERA